MYIQYSGSCDGGDASVIEGTVKVTGGEANLYLMNPAGVILGKDAQFDFIFTHLHFPQPIGSKDL
jgi:hypothetical protein